MGVVVFPGSNCDADAKQAAELAHASVELLWHDTTSLKNVDAVVLPGGFSYGDYLRCGAIARFSKLMTEIQAFAKKGGPVIGICNGFQILTECGLVEGALLQNVSLKFQCETVQVTVEQTDTVYTKLYTQKATLNLPIAHGEGNFQADSETLKALENEGRVVFRYTTDVNGAANRIAGIVNKNRNVLGMMPHPERACETLLGSTDGLKLFQSLLS